MRMRSWRAAVGPPALALLLIACGEAPAPDPLEDGSAGASPAAPEPSERPERPGIRFDPATVRPGDPVGALVLNTIDARPNAVDSTRVGVARFDGRLELTGRVMPHPDDNLRGESVCFEADEASAARMPRWLHDERRAWFCFSNPGEAAAALGPAGEGEVPIVIDDFTIHRGLSDEVNSARFVERPGVGSAAR